MNASYIVWINYGLIGQFSALAIGWWLAGDKLQSLYWLGAVSCTVGVTFR